MKLYLRKGSERGTTLAEVIIATAIIAIVSGGLVGSFSYGFFSAQVVRENQRATQIMVEKLETIRLYSWDQVNSNNFIPATFVSSFDPQGASNRQGCQYYGTMNISAVPWSSSYSTNLRQLSLSLTWTNQGKLRHTRSLTTYIARDGVQNYVY